MKPIRKFIADANDSLRDMFRRRRISVSDPENRLETRYIHISPVGFAMSVVATIFLIFCIVLAIVAYTPVLDFLPGYRTDATKSRETLMRTLIRIDSLERKMNDMLAYNESMILVVDGKTPVMRTVQNDSLPRDKSIVPASQADSLLRSQMEGDGKYGIRSSSNGGRININAVAPMDGIIAERFDMKNGSYGIRIAGAPESQIVAIADGTVILNDWSPETGNSIAIQHPNGVISVYRRLSGTLASKGQRVKGNEVIGYSTAGEEKDDLSTFAFELWSDGKPVDPESYILF